MFFTALVILVIVTILVGLNALYVAGEFASVASRRSRIQKLAESGNRRAALILPVIEDPRKLDHYIAASQVGITLSSIMLGVYGQRTIAPLLEPFLVATVSQISPSFGATLAAAGISAILVLLLLTTLQVVFGELLPKSVALQDPERLALLTALPMRISADILLRPLIAILNGSGALILRLLGFEPGREHEHVHSPEEINILVRESYRGGLLNYGERQLLRSTFEFTDKTAGEIAIPRTKIVAAPISTSLQELLERVAESSYSRILIYEDDIDHVLGFVHLREIFQQYQIDRSSEMNGIIREIPFIPESLPANEVWDVLSEHNSYLALVFDEYGGTSGLITQEDLIEELFGELQDEFDDERASWARQPDGGLLVVGEMPVEQLKRLLQLKTLPSHAFTVGGLVTEKLGRSAEVGDRLLIEGYDWEVRSMEGVSIDKISIRPDGSLLIEEKDQG